MSRPSMLQASSSSQSINQRPQQLAQPKPSTPYTPSLHELQWGPKNRLFLSLRSGIPDDVDWALPRLVLASFEYPEQFKLESYVDSVRHLQAYPEEWVGNLERLATIHAIRRGLPAQGDVAALVPEWTVDPMTEKRATECLLVLRNASFIGTNARLICRASFLAFLLRFFSLPIDFLVEAMIEYPEAFSHIFTILSNIFSHFQLDATTDFAEVFSNTIPRLFIATRDTAMITLLLPLILHSTSPNSNHPLPTELVGHIMMLITLKPPPQLLDLLLDTLISLTVNPLHSRQLLTDPKLSVYLRTLVPILERDAKPFAAKWDSSPAYAGKVVKNPASPASIAEESSKRRTREREAAQRVMEMGGDVDVPVGDKPPVLPQAIKNKLYAMKESARSIAWMHETFVYSSRSQLLQVTFWHAYRDFFNHPNTVEQLMSASEVIRNVTIAFPGASAKIWVDEMGTQKFVIAGMGFRRGGNDDEKFSCQWRGCPGSRHTSSTELLNHLLLHTQASMPQTCCWASCSARFNYNHLLTHIPTSTTSISIPETITLHPSVPDYLASSPRPTALPPAPLPRSVKLSFTGQITPSDPRRQPTGAPFLTALILRNLAKALRTEIALKTPIGEPGANGGSIGDKKKHLLEERYGLPIPEYVLREEEEEERNLVDASEEGLTDGERERAVGAFESVEERILEVMEKNMAGLGSFLSTSVGW